MAASASPTVVPSLVLHRLHGGFLQNAGPDGAAHHGAAEAAAFLVGPVDQLDRRLGRDVEVVQRAQHFQPGDNAERAVELAAGGLAIQMRAHQHRQAVGIPALAPGEHVAHGIGPHLGAERLAMGAEKVAAAAVLLGQGDALDAAFFRAADLGVFHQRVPEPGAVDSLVGQC